MITHLYNIHKIISFFIVAIFSLCLINSPVCQRQATAAWGIVTVRDTADNLGWYTSLAFDPLTGEPAISYYNSTTQNLEFVRRVGGVWGVPIIVDSAGNVGLFTSLAFDVAGRPAIAYYKDITGGIGGDLKFAYDKNDDGDFADVGEIITVASAGNVGRYRKDFGEKC